MPETVTLPTGLHVPASIVQAAAKSIAAGNAHPSGRGGWVSMGDGYGAGDRLRNYEDFLSAITIPWVYQAGSTVAQHYAKNKYNIVKGRKEETIDEDDPALNQLLDLLDNPNPAQTGRQFRELLCWHLELTGNAFLVMDNRDGNISPLTGRGRPTELHLLRPSRVRIQPDPQQYIKGYFYDINGDGRGIPYDPRDVIWFKKANPLDPYWGLGIIEAGLTVFKKQKAIARTEVNYFDSGARVKGVLKYDGTMTDEQADEIRAEWRAMDEGASGSYRTAILEGKMDYQVISTDLLSNGAGMETLAHMARDEILTLWGVPKQKIGIFEDANYRSIEADSFFIAETMAPRFLDANDGWTVLCRQFVPDWRFKHNEEVVVDYYDKAITAHYMSQAAAFTRNEIRVTSGQEPLETGDDRGLEIVGPTNMTIFEVGGPAQEGPLPGPGTGHPGDTSAASDDSASASPLSPDGPAAALYSVMKKSVRARQNVRRCTCPREVIVQSKSATALDLGICPMHLRAVDHVLTLGRDRKYSTQQMTEGYATENYLGIKGILGRA